ncbi:hypothetical protein KCP75_07320 [Salmonella enterica subsp. enterica]|nr:hypothetical protein KCP75_07320 [Salmonella enterica subsp. enterica]
MIIRPWRAAAITGVFDPAVRSLKQHRLRQNAAGVVDAVWRFRNLTLMASGVD